MAREDDPVQKVAILGPTLSSMIQRVSSSDGDIDGLLFGHVTSSSLLSLSDDSPSTSSTSSLTATVTSFITTKPYSFYTSLGQIDVAKLRALNLPQSLTLIGWFSARRYTHNRPSMRESAVTRSLASISDLHFPVHGDSSAESRFLFAPCFFLLFTTPNNADVNTTVIHTHEYRAFQLRKSPRLSFNPVSINVVNIGPAFRSHYGDFSPISAFPMLQFETRRNPMVEDRVESLSDKKRVARDQRQLDMCTHGFQVGKLSRLIGSEAVNNTSGLEDLYGSMLAKLEDLASQVEKSNNMIIDKENSNMKLRNKVGGLD